MIYRGIREHRIPAIRSGRHVSVLVTWIREQVAAAQEEAS